MEEITMEDHPDHWKSTLLGEDFWKDAEAFYQAVNDDIETGEFITSPSSTQSIYSSGTLPEHDQLLHKFPFNLGPEQGSAPCPSTSTDETPPKQQPQQQEQEKDQEKEQQPGRRRRRFSMNDAFSLSSLNLNPSRFRRHSRSRSRSRSPTRPPSVLSETRRSNSLLRFAFNMASNNRKKKDEDVESVHSFRGPNDPGTPEKPLMFFRGGASWNVLPRDMQAIGIDLFWPVKQNQEGDREVLHIEELAPLCQFRGLRVLKITGMLQSYQKYIWQAAWLNTELEELELGMAIGPRIRRNFPGDWPFIKGGWTLKEDTYGEPVY